MSSYIEHYVSGRRPDRALSSKRVVVFHAADMDGRLGAAVAFKALEWDAYYLGLNRETVTAEDLLKTFPHMERLILIDYSFSPSIIEDLLKAGILIVLLDHHETAIKAIGSAICDWHCQMKERLSGILPIRISDDAVCRSNIKYLDDERHSGVSLAWNYFFPGDDLPRAVNLIRVYDTWSTTSPEWQDALYLNTALIGSFEEYLDFNAELLQELLNDKTGAFCGTYVRRGENAEQVQRIYHKGMARSYGGTLEWEGLTFFALNGSGNSRVAEAALKEGIHQAILLYRWSPKNGCWKVSLFNSEAVESASAETKACKLPAGKWARFCLRLPRFLQNLLGFSYKETTRLCDIATKYGGGGHPGACGFSVKELPFKLIDIKPLRG